MRVTNWTTLISPRATRPILSLWCRRIRSCTVFACRWMHSVEDGTRLSGGIRLAGPDGERGAAPDLTITNRLTTSFNDTPATLGGGPNGLGLSTSFGMTSRTVKICMQHPEHEKSQVVVELLENEGQKD